MRDAHVDFSRHLSCLDLGREVGGGGKRNLLLISNTRVGVNGLPCTYCVYVCVLCGAVADGGGFHQRVGPSPSDPRADEHDASSPMTSTLVRAQNVTVHNNSAGECSACYCLCAHSSIGSASARVSV